MTTFAELLLNGISMGAVYALIALGFVIIFKASEVVNFAHASLLLAGGFITAKLHVLFGAGRSSNRRRRGYLPPSGCG